MEFRAHIEAAKQNAIAFSYLTKNLENPERGRATVSQLIEELGCCVSRYPDWHPIINAPKPLSLGDYCGISNIPAYKEADHTIKFATGFVTCPYSESKANELVRNVNAISGLAARRLEHSLYADGAYPVVVSDLNTVTESDGTIVSRDALTWFAEQLIRSAHDSQVAETWWNIRINVLGTPHGARSSLLVNQHTGIQMRKILEVLNNSGIFGPILESSLDMLPKKQRDLVAETLIRAALSAWNKRESEFEFQFRGEVCFAHISDTFKDGSEFAIKVLVGDNELSVGGFKDIKRNTLTWTEPTGKRVLAKKFM